MYLVCNDISQNFTEKNFSACARYGERETSERASERECNCEKPAKLHRFAEDLRRFTITIDTFVEWFSRET